ncbi:MAG: aminopeptidase P family protein [Oscillospiraceae bacterium]|nr:aminopeptidase P family protein [Oscillospiraceae bacterium]
MNSLINFLNNQDEIDAGIVVGSDNRFYFCNAKTSDGILLVNKKEAFLLVDSRYLTYCEEVAKDCNVILMSDCKKQIQNFIRECKAKKVGVDVSNVSMKDFKYFSSLSEGTILDSDALENAIRDQRAIKDETEIENIKAGQNLLDMGFVYILEHIKPGISELELAAKLEFYLRQQGAQKVAFDFIVTSGVKTALPHGMPGDKLLYEGDLVMIDFGVIYNNYCSDMTRTVAVKKASEKQREIYGLVLNAQKLAIDAIRPGGICKEIDLLARNFLNQKGVKDYFGHGLGHGLGLAVHEKPNLSSCSCDIISKGNVVTVEPGIYLKSEFGVRIEDTVIVTDFGTQNITKSFKEELLIV